MSDVIYKVSHMIGDPEFAINMAMHSLILFSFLSIFFLYYITTLAKNAFNQEITHLMNDGLEKPIEELKSNPYVKQVLNVIPSEKLLALYSREDKAVIMHNNGLANTVFMTNALLWGMLIIVIIIIKYSCGKKVHVKEVVIENLITFTFVGIVEFMFFKHIAFKFIPVAPSFISQQFLEKVQKLF